MSDKLAVMSVLKKISFFLFFYSFLASADLPSQIEGLYQDPFVKKIYLMDRFLTFDPKVVWLDCSLDDEKLCKKRWPHGTFVFADPFALNNNLPCDLLWVDSGGAELIFFQQAASLLKQAKVVYTSTHFFHQGAYYQKLKQTLESFDFRLLIHWIWPNQYGKAIFVKREILEASLHSLNYYPSGSIGWFQEPLEIKNFSKEAKNKFPVHRMEGIDFIYMINLDERPEKFALASSALQPFGIYPYRFSAVNGWKLAASTLNQLGVRFFPGSIQEKFLGTLYKEAGGAAHMSNELIQENGDAYFTLGMSPGAIGIILSHLSILQDAYDSGYETIWIMEDDVEPIDDPRQIPEMIRKLDQQIKEWDILFTDTDTKDNSGAHVPCRAIAARPNAMIQPLSSFFERFYPVSNEFSRIGMRYGAYSMIVRRSGMKKILEYFRMNHLYLPYDMDFWLVPNIQLYCVNRDIVSHRVGAPSDNSAPFYLKKHE